MYVCFVYVDGGINDRLAESDWGGVISGDGSRAGGSAGGMNDG